MLTPSSHILKNLAQKLEGKRCLVTGASGFVGRNMIALLLSINAEVSICTYRRTEKDIPMGTATQSYPCDLAILEEVEALFAEVKPEYIFHFATARGDFKSERYLYIRNNILVAENLIQSCAKYKPLRMVVGQSSLEYGVHNTPFKETTTLNPHTIHGSSKAAATLLFQEASYSMNLPIVILRFFSIYGYWEPWKRLIPTTMKALQEQQILSLTNNNDTRDFIFVEDVLEACILGAFQEDIEGEIFNIGTGLETSNQEIVTLLSQITNRTLIIDKKAFPSRITDTSFWSANPNKAKEYLHWSPRHSLFEGLEKTWKWFDELPSKYL